MALIKCPECNKDVSTEATSCPHCGYPLSKIFNNNLNTKYPTPKSSKWLNDWKITPTLTKAIVFGSFIVSLILWFVFMWLLNNDKESEYNMILEETFYYEKDIWISLTTIFGLLTFFLFISAIVSFFVIRIIIKNIDGYNVVVYFGFWKNRLIIENVEYDSNWGSIFHNTLLVGELPNGKQLTVTLSSGSTSFKTEELSYKSINHESTISENKTVSKVEVSVQNENKNRSSNESLIVENNIEMSDETKEIIKNINEDLLLLSYETDLIKIEKLKKITKLDYDKLLKCSDIDKDEILKIKKKINDAFKIFSKH